MKKLLSNTKVAIILLMTTIFALGFYAYMLLCPISYAMPYHNESEYEGEIFRGIQTFYSNGTVDYWNTNFETEINQRYYYKDGYVFSIMAETDEEYEAEVVRINEDFDDALNTPFYASKINAFRLVSEGVDGYVSTYTCSGFIIFAIGGGVFVLLMLALTALSFVFSNKQSAKGKK